MIGARTAVLSGGRKFKLSNIGTLTQSTGISPFDIPVTTRTGNILFFLCASDTSGTVESPYTLFYDPAGANLAFTQHKVLAGNEGSGRPRMVIATIKGVPLPFGVAKTVRFTTFAANLSGYCIMFADIPASWSGAIGNFDASVAFNVSQPSHTSPGIVTAAAGSIVVIGGGVKDGTLGALVLSGQGGPYSAAGPALRSAVSVSGYQALYGHKVVAKAGVACSATIGTLSGVNSTDFSAGVVEIRP